MAVMHASDTSLSQNHLPAASSPRSACRDGIISKSYFIPSADAGIALHMRNKRLASMTVFDRHNVILYVHGSPEPAESSLDLRLSGPSWMDHLAARGFDVYFVNLRGHGRSTRPVAMSRPAQVEAPCITSAEAGRDLMAAIAHILRRRKLARLSLIGWSRGCVAIGVFAEQHPEKVNRMVMIAPSYGISTPPAAIDRSAYVAFDRAAAMERWLQGVPAARRHDFVPAAWVDTWWRVNMKADPEGARLSPQVYRGPLGWYQFADEYRAAGKPFFYDPGRIRSPVLLIAGEWDLISPPAGCQSLFEAMTAAAGRQFIQLAGGTHYMHREKVGAGLIRQVAAFLADPGR